MAKVTESIPGYSYGSPEVARSPVSVEDLERLKTSAGFTEEDERHLRLAGGVLADQTQQIVSHWRSGIIAGIPNLARHPHTGRKRDPRIPRQQQSSFRAMDSRHLPTKL